MSEESLNFVEFLINGFPNDYKSSRGIPRARFIVCSNNSIF